MRLELHWRDEDGVSLPVTVWRAGPGYRMIASGVVGGGLGERAWVLNAQVPGGYDRIDPAAHIAELAAGLGLAGDGVGLLTAASVTDLVEREDEGVQVAATVGLRVPTWAAAAPGTADPEFGPIRRAGIETGTVDRELGPTRRPGTGTGAVEGGARPNWRPGAGTGTVEGGAGPAWRPGTINIIVLVPVPLSDAAYVNAVITATEAKTQALLEAGVRATGTASDAVCIAAPTAGAPEDFAGPRSAWGARIARAVHAAMYAGALQDAEGRKRLADGAGDGWVGVSAGTVRTTGC